VISLPKQLGSLTLTVLAIFFFVVIALANLFLLLAGLLWPRLTTLLALITLVLCGLTALLTLFFGIFRHEYSSNPKYEPPRTPENL
jgi:Na+/proline symporter